MLGFPGLIYEVVMSSGSKSDNSGVSVGSGRLVGIAIVCNLLVYFLTVEIPWLLIPVGVVAAIGAVVMIRRHYYLDRDGERSGVSFKSAVGLTAILLAFWGMPGLLLGMLPIIG